ncbi:predicted protein [Naegleria gruberi]|uniref:Predicted protein n=1 Tax=Naegleria gruberi TaxID=5762 RepID=D2VZ62_NAEGR|nr:uncharacterized protein NAEGRDRAFT_53421 [Naegleria gruberi]EFC37936.1 predicted protein [Naegleria gruberi]|eukprot:XP_002670680.1 predicted protein [Naegleria gruberi strain NEG-M]
MKKTIQVSLLIVVVVVAVLLTVVCAQFELGGLSFHAVVDEEDPYYNGKIVYNNQVVDDPEELKKILISKQPIPSRLSTNNDKIDCQELILQKVSSLFFKKQTEEYGLCTQFKECMFKYARDVVLHLLQVFEMKAELEFPTGKTVLNLVMNRIDKLAKETYINFQSDNDKILQSKECTSTGSDKWIKPLFSFNGNVYTNPCKAAQDEASHPLTDISFHFQHTTMEFDFPKQPRSSVPKRILLKHYLQIVIRIIKCIKTYLKDQCILSTDSRILDHAQSQLELIILDLDQIPLPEMNSNHSNEFIEQVLQLQKDTIQNIKVILEQVSRHFA